MTRDDDRLRVVVAAPPEVAWSWLTQPPLIARGSAGSTTGWARETFAS